jgi:hypothetical protein
MAIEGICPKECLPEMIFEKEGMLTSVGEFEMKSSETRCEPSSRQKLSVSSW